MSYSLLVVDDNAIMRRMTIHTISLANLSISEIREAANGQEALEALRRKRADMVSLDLNMPVMDGETFLNRPRQDQDLKQTPVIVVSTESSITRIARLRVHGAGFIHKPFQPQELLDAVTRLLSFLATGPAHV